MPSFGFWNAPSRVRPPSRKTPCVTPLRVMMRALRRLLDREVVVLCIEADRVDDLAAAEDLQLDGGVAALELESVDVDAALALETARVALAERERDDGQAQHRGEDLD